MYLVDWLLNPDSRREAQGQTSWLRSLCRRLGLVLILEKLDLVPSQKAIYMRIELDFLAGIHSSAVATCCTMAAGTGTLSFSGETSTIWSGLNPSTTVASKTALEPRAISPVPPVPVPLGSQSLQFIQWWTNMDNLRKGIKLGTVAVE